MMVKNVGIGAEDLLCERHSAALTKFLFHLYPFNGLTLQK
jgi:hypothetical protein